MDEIFNRVGQYEIVVLLITGLTVLTVGAYLGLPIVPAIDNDANAFFVLIFIVESYSIGIILQEVGGWADNQIFHFRESISSGCLSSRVIQNPLELDEFQKMANYILRKKTDNHEFTSFESSYVLSTCNRFLEVNGKDGKAEKFESLGDMSRSFMVAFPTLGAWYVIMGNFSGQMISQYKILMLFFFTLVSYSRSKRFTTYRVRTLLRHYRELTYKTLQEDHQ